MSNFSESPSTRGLRNNNPFNIVKSKVKWLGAINGHDRKFVTFSSMELGVRAGVKLLINYIRYKGPVYDRCDTLEKIISRFAPSVENDTLQYIKFLEHYVGIERHVQIKYPSLEFRKLCCGIMFYESQYVVPESYISVIINQFKLY